MAWTNQTKNRTAWSGIGFLLLENLSFLLQETGDKIIIGVADKTSTSWTNQTKN
jgi:RsiW-degrading membrane proteinase PrsW (M82 family)